MDCLRELVESEAALMQAVAVVKAETSSEALLSESQGGLSQESLITGHLVGRPSFAAAGVCRCNRS
jgi:hypothetical protein